MTKTSMRIGAICRLQDLSAIAHDMAEFYRDAYVRASEPEDWHYRARYLMQWKYWQSRAQAESKAARGLMHIEGYGRDGNES